MSVRSIAIVGAGPIGIEAALLALERGHQVHVFERGQVGENLRRWGHVRMFSPFGMNVSPWGLATLRAENPAWVAPDEGELLSGRELVDSYLAPLAHTRRLASYIHEGTEVVAMGRSRLLKGELPGDVRRGGDPFRLLLRDARGEHAVTADVVIDASGTYPWHNWLGAGGIPAAGEAGARGVIEYGLPDILGADRMRYSGRRVLVVGSGYSAATTVVSLARLARESPGTHITWVTRHEEDSPATGPIARIEHDRLPERDALAAAANALAKAGSAATGALPLIVHLAGTVVEGVDYDAAADRFTVQLVGQHAQSLTVDRIVANVGYRPDRGIYEELQVHECYATQGPMKLAAALLGASTGDCLDQTTHGPHSLLNPEPNFFVLGAKSFGRSSQFLLSIGLRQVEEVFALSDVK